MPETQTDLRYDTLVFTIQSAAHARDRLDADLEGCRLAIQRAELRERHRDADYFRERRETLKRQLMNAELDLTHAKAALAEYINHTMLGGA